jgi:hypothetical protein
MRAIIAIHLATREWTANEELRLVDTQLQADILMPQNQRFQTAVWIAQPVAAKEDLFLLNAPHNVIAARFLDRMKQIQKHLIFQIKKTALGRFSFFILLLRIAQEQLGF